MVQPWTYNAAYILYIGLFTMLMGGIFVLNQIEDVESDRLNNKLYLIAQGHISATRAYAETGLLIGLPILTLVLVRRDLAVVACLAALIMGWLYSCSPFRLKDRPIGGLMANVAGGSIVFSFGWMITGRPDTQMLLHGIPYVLGLVAVYFFTTIPDMGGDRAANKITVAVRYGAAPVLMAGLVTDVLAIIASALMRDWVILCPTLLVLPFFINARVVGSVDSVLRTNKFATLFLSLIICIRFPAYLALITFVFFLSKWYYKVRFNINYPSFRT
jgi:4-hydroxybenzoate polyprenyltransferase